MSKKFHPKDQLLQELVSSFEESIHNDTNVFIAEEDLDQLIEYYESLPNYEKAFLAVQRGIDLFPYSGSFHLKKAQLYFQVKEYQDAWDAIETAKVFDSTSTEILLLQSDLFCVEANYKSAISMLKQLSSVVSSNERVDVWLEIADVYSMANKSEELGKALQKVLNAKPLNEEALHRYWNHISETQSFSTGISFFEEIIDKMPYNFLAWYYLAKAHQEINQYDDAIESYEYSLAINSYYFAYWDFGMCLQESNNWVKATSVYDEMLDKFDQDTSIYIELAICEKNLGNKHQAIDYLEKAKTQTKDKHKKANCEYQMGAVYEFFEDYANAVKSYQNALEIRPTKSKYWNALGTCFLNNNRIEDASNCFFQSLDCNDEQPKQWLKLATCYFKLDATDQLLDTLQKAQAIFPDHVKLNYYYAAYLIQLGYSQSGLLQLDYALNLDASKKNYIFALFPELNNQMNVIQLCDQF